MDSYDPVCGLGVINWVLCHLGHSLLVFGILWLGLDGVCLQALVAGLASSCCRKGGSKVAFLKSDYRLHCFSVSLLSVKLTPNHHSQPSTTLEELEVWLLKVGVQNLSVTPISHKHGVITKTDPKIGPFSARTPTFQQL